MTECKHILNWSSYFFCKARQALSSHVINRRRNFVDFWIISTLHFNHPLRKFLFQHFQKIDYRKKREEFIRLMISLLHGYVSVILHGVSIEIFWSKILRRAFNEFDSVECTVDDIILIERNDSICFEFSYLTITCQINLHWFVSLFSSLVFSKFENDYFVFFSSDLIFQLTIIMEYEWSISGVPVEY